MAVDSGRWIIRAFRTPPDDDGSQQAIQQVRRMRARILHDRGRRPEFTAEDGTHADEQELDHEAWHFVGYRAGSPEPLGYVRLSTGVSDRLFQSRAHLGDDGYTELLTARGLRVGQVFEHSRLVVEHRARKLGLGVHLNAMAIAAADHLGAAAMIGTSGTADGQDRFHERFGFRRVEGTRRYVEHYTEDVVIMLRSAAGGADGHTDGHTDEHAALIAGCRSRFPAIVTDPSEVLDPAGTAARPLPAGLRAEDAQRRQAWRPTLYDLRVEADHDALETLLASGAVREVCDTIEDQLAELVRSREPGRALDAGALRDAVADQLAGVDAARYGTWVWYPWTGRLVHLLPEDEFRLIRTDRNRGKIERPEQRRLLGRRIGVIGLSVGSAAAVTLAQEGVGGAFKLADFDTLGLSNLNRLRAGVHDLGVPKTVLAARQMFEIDPYLDIEIYSEGLTDATAAAFFTGGHGPIDLLVEECDTPYVKLASREWARAAGIPVLMDANDRGLLDVERFDLEPDRPLLHGLLGGTSADQLRDLGTAQLIDVILAMVDADRISPELAASIPRIGRTLSSWPQLASGVALGGALVVEAARRVLLGLPCASGRYYTDLAETLAAERSVLGDRVSLPAARDAGRSRAVAV